MRSRRTGACRRHRRRRLARLRDRLPHEGPEPAPATTSSELCRVDVNKVGEAGGTPREWRGFSSASRATSPTHAAATTLAPTPAAPTVRSNDDTVREYLDALERLMVVENQPAWSTHLRSTHRLRRLRSAISSTPRWRPPRWGPTPERLLRELRLLRTPLRVAGCPRSPRLRPGGRCEGPPIPRQRRSGGRCGRRGLRRPLGGVRGKARLQPDRRRSGEPHEIRPENRHTSAANRPCSESSRAANYGYKLENGVQVIPIGALGP